MNNNEITMKVINLLLENNLTFNEMTDILYAAKDKLSNIIVPTSVTFRDTGKSTIKNS